ncbi:beta-ribofuranosylaminobenzene 5'-phosphate synthase family protein [Methanonatronarchaeum sp. AMET-Sl]|uniref:beta-ribofuranosylaminobenzene 5'-phosphate synthase family protein n=1 Tax=Methanonatronarchaeum sp. AMET-Sl TaxID=3037654 RepID=UPI00244DDD09|nr:beta-ribofuranosylaminobenzene 5'-phosphate synthase family protein [Methanonatronarchaeum sp. AMET-Sl]WGI17690.1 hypothetical protein QEN48_01395 [Methanonatronarchaeum sp. AMET-Sl]
MSVIVSAPARLHLGFINLSDEYPLRYGGVGLAIQEPRNKFKIKKSNQTTIKTNQNIPESHIESIRERTEKIVRYLGVGGVEVEVESVIPMHKGFGSGTQTTLSILTAIKHLYDTEVDVELVAEDLGRFKYSRVGLNTFRDGGFVVEAGETGQIYRTNFPKEWKILIAVPPGTGVSGKKEQKALQKLLPTTPRYTEKVSAEILCRMIPSINKDLQEFNKAIHNIQQQMGQTFKPIQNGQYATKKGQKLTKKLQKISKGVGQSSWGPTIYQITNKQNIKKSRKQAKKIIKNVFITNPDNQGATIKKNDG